MKKQSIINKIEKATKKNFAINENGMYWLKYEKSTVSFFIDSDKDVHTICVKTDSGDTNPWNANCYNSFFKSIKSVVNYIS